MPFYPQHLAGTWKNLCREKLGEPASSSAALLSPFPSNPAPTPSSRKLLLESACSLYFVNITSSGLAFSLLHIVSPARGLLFSYPVVSDSAIPQTEAGQASLSFTISRSLLKLMSIESVMLSNHLIFIALFSCLQSFPASRSFSTSCLFT